MNKQDFLNTLDVQKFIEWFCNKLLNAPFNFNINIQHSRFVPNGLQLNTNSLEEVCLNYQWNANWTDREGNLVQSSDWTSTKNSLLTLSSWLKDALNNHNETELHRAAYATLQWGGVRSAKPFLDDLLSSGELVNYFANLQEKIKLETANLNNLNSDSVLRFDAGLTKIHALLSGDGLPIYDSRVAAAISAFVYLYHRETSGNITNLRFPVTEARGKQIRHLRDLPNGNVFPRLYVSYADWAKAQVKLGWIIEEVLNRTNWFANEEFFANRMHAMEASLFMIGYDLRCMTALFPIEPPIQNTNLNQANKPTENNEKIALTLWNQPFAGSRVPASHNFTRVINFYRAFREQNPENNEINAFSDWLINNHNFANNTATAYCYPLRDAEMGIRHLSDTQIVELAENPTNEFSQSFLNDWKDCDIDEALPNCIANIYIAGLIAEKGLRGQAAQNQIVNWGFAGTLNAAQAILSVGRSMGRHFGLLTENNQPTDFFYQYFSQTR